MTLPRILGFLISIVAIASCERSASHQPQEFGRNVQLISQEDSKSGGLELEFHLVAKNPDGEVRLRFGLAESTMLRGVTHYPSETIVSFIGDEDEYRFCYADLLSSGNRYGRDELLKIDQFKRKSGANKSRLSNRP